MTLRTWGRGACGDGQLRSKAGWWAGIACNYKLSSISAAIAGATAGGRTDGGTDCHKVAGVPFFFVGRADQSNQAPRCLS